MNGSLKLIGSVLLLAGCGYGGYSAGRTHLTDIRLIGSICNMVSRMINELQYRQPPLSGLLQVTAEKLPKQLSEIITELSTQMQRQVFCNISAAVAAILRKRKDIPPNTSFCLQEFADHLGEYDLAGQVRELESVLLLCNQRKTQLESESNMRVRGYQVFGLCIGALLAIVLI